MSFESELESIANEVYGVTPAPAMPEPESPYDAEMESIANEVYSSPEYAPPEKEGLLASAGKGLAHGTIGIGESLGVGAQWLGNRIGSETIAKAGETASEYYAKKAEGFTPPADIAEKNVWDNPELLANASWWVYNVAEMVPSLAATMGAAVLTGGAAAQVKTIQIAGKVIEFTPKVVRLLASIGGGVVGGGLEGTQTYKAVLAEGGSEQEASNAAMLMGSGSAALNALGVGKILDKAGGSFKAKVYQKLGAGVWEGLTEGAEEPWEVISKLTARYLSGEELPGDIKEQFIQSLKEAITVAPIAAVTGLGGAIMPGGVKQIKEQDKLVEPIEESTPAPPLDSMREGYVNGKITPEELAMAKEIWSDDAAFVAGIDEMLKPLPKATAKKEAVVSKTATVVPEKKPDMYARNQAIIDEAERQELYKEAREKYGFDPETFAVPIGGIEAELRNKFASKVDAAIETEQTLPEAERIVSGLTPADIRGIEENIFKEWNAKAKSAQYSEPYLRELYAGLEDNAFKLFAQKAAQADYTDADRPPLAPESSQKAPSPVSSAGTSEASGQVSRTAPERTIEKTNILAPHQAEAKRLGITFNGMQERLNKPSLPMFTDNETKSSFLVKPEETTEEALQRTRAKYKPEEAKTPNVLGEAKEPFRMTKDEFDTAFGKPTGKATVTGGFDAHKDAIKTAINAKRITPEEAIAKHKESYPDIETWAEMKEKTGRLLTKTQQAENLRKESGSLATYDRQSQKEWLGGKEPSDKLTIYRASKDGSEIQPGDYVTNDLAYAKRHIKDNLGGKGKIAKIDGTLDDIFPADAPREFWYAPEMKAEAKGEGVRADFDSYLLKVNPDGKMLTEKQRPTVLADDMEGMADGSTLVKKVGGVEIRTDGESFYAVKNKKTVGFVSPLSENEIDLTVAKEYQKQGIGTALLTEFRRKNPSYQAGGYTEGGLKTEKKVFEALKPATATTATLPKAKLSDAPTREITKKTGEGKGEIGAKEPLPEKQPVSAGKTSKSFTTDNKPIESKFAVYESDDLIVSHDTDFNENPDYPQDFQPRDRDRKAMRLQVEEYANQLNPERLGESTAVSSGAPIVGNDAIVESGNGRIIAIRKAYKYNEGKGEAYRKWIIDNAESFGLDKAAIEGLKNPVLVRIRQTEVDRTKFVKEANKPEVARMSPVEQAKSDADMLTPSDIDSFLPSEEGNIGAASNRPFITKFIKKIGSNEAAGYLTEEGAFTKQLIDRIQAAIFYKAYQDKTILALMAEEADTNIKNILNALIVAAPDFVRARTIDLNLDNTGIVEDIIAGAMLVRKARNDGIMVAELVNQIGLFEQIADEVKLVAGTIDEHKRSAAKLGIIFKSMGKILKESLSERKNALLPGFTSDKIDSKSIIETAIKRFEEEGRYGQKGLFAGQEKVQDTSDRGVAEGSKRDLQDQGEERTDEEKPGSETGIEKANGRKPSQDNLADVLIANGAMDESARGKKQYAYLFRNAIPNNKWLSQKEIYNRLWNPGKDAGTALADDLPKWVNADLLERRYKLDGTPVYAWSGTEIIKDTISDAEADKLFSQIETLPPGMFKETAKKYEASEQLSLFKQTEGHIQANGEHANKSKEIAKKIEQDHLSRTAKGQTVAQSLANYKSAVAKEYGEKKRIDYTGQVLEKGKEAQTLADLFYVYRTPKQEILHAIYTDADGKILSHNALSSGALDYVSPKDTFQYVYKLRDTMKRLGAAKVHLLHNHPSGDPTMSQNDSNLFYWIKAGTGRPNSPSGLGDSFGEFIVINGGKYMFAKYEGKNNIVGDYKNYSGKRQISDWLLYKKQLSNPYDVAMFGRSLEWGKDQIALVYLNNKKRVQGWSSHDKGLLDKPVDELKKIISQQAKAHDAQTTVIMIKNLSDAEALMKKAKAGNKPSSWLTDVVSENGDSMLSSMPYLFEESGYDKKTAKALFEDKEEYKTKSKKEMQESFLKQHFPEMAPGYDKITNESSSVSDVINTKNSMKWSKDTKKDLSWFDKAFSSAEFYSEKDPAYKRYMDVIFNAASHKYELQNKILGTFVDSSKELEKNDKKFGTNQYKRLSDYLDKTDRFISGYSLKEVTTAFGEQGFEIYSQPILGTVNNLAEAAKLTAGNADAFVAPSGNKLIVFGKKELAGEYATEKEAVAAMTEDEVADYVKQNRNASDAEMETLRDTRSATNEQFDLLTAQMRQMIAESKAKNEAEMQVIVGFDEKEDGSKTPIRKSLSWVLNEMGNLRGSYMPRQRPQGKYVLIAKRGENDRIREHFDLPATEGTSKLAGIGKLTIPMQRRANELVKQGYTVSYEKSKALPETVFEAAKLVAATDAMLKAGLENIEGTKEGEALKTELSNLLSEAISNLFKARGFRSQMIKRGGEIGDAVWKGYETDLSKRVIGAANSVASGIAKRDKALNMMLAIMGKDISFAEFQKQNPNPKGPGHKSLVTYKDYIKMVEARRIDPKTQQAMYADIMDHAREVLRNDEAVDRIVGTAKGVASVWFLGFRVSSAAVNGTNMAVLVPAVMHGIGKIPYHKTFGLIGSAMKSYVNFRMGREISASDSRVLAQVKKRGWDAAQFNQDAYEALLNKTQGAWNTFTSWGMWMFSKVEELNRGATILAAFNGLDSKLSFEEKLTQAKHISDRAHGIYDKSTRPAIARGTGLLPAMARAAVTFTKYSHTYLLDLVQLTKDEKSAKAVAHMLLAPAILGGLGSSILFPIIAAAAKALGFGGDDPEEEWYKYAEENWNMGTWFRHGIAGLGGYGVNLKGSLSIGFTQLSSLESLLGAPYAVPANIIKGTAMAIKGDVAKGIEKAVPLALGAPLRGVRESGKGLTTGGEAPIFYGKKPVVGTPMEAMWSFMAFNPSRTSAIKEELWRERKVEQVFTERKSDIYAKYRKMWQEGTTAERFGELTKETERFNEDVEVAKGRGFFGVTPITKKALKAQKRKLAKPSKKEQKRIVGDEEPIEEGSAYKPIKLTGGLKGINLRKAIQLTK